MSTVEINRRSFLKGAAAAGAAVVAAEALSATSALADEAAEDAIEWADEAEVVIVGMGCAGLSAACTLTLEGLASCLVLEAAPESFRGGNSSATSGIIFCPDSEEAAIEYQTALNAGYTVPDDVMEAWAAELCSNLDWMAETFGTEFTPCAQGTWGIQGEYPNMPRAQECPAYNVTEGTTWNVFASAFDEMDVPVYYEARAVELITNDEGEVIGVATEDGRNFKATKGVLLACGGFEANAEMMQEHLPTGYTDTLGKGSWYNRGDGIKMAQALGAQLWHMNNVSGAALGLRMTPANDDYDSRTWTKWATHNYIFVDDNAHRFQDEDVLYTELLRHGKQYHRGCFTESALPTGCWAIFGDDEFNSGSSIFSSSCFAAMKAVEDRFTSNQEGLDAGIIVKCETVEELAEATGLDADTLAGTIEEYNEMADANYDWQFFRGQAMNEYSELMTAPGNEDDDVVREAFDLVRIEAPYYVTELVGTVLNTQGGPKRSANCEILDVLDEPIPRLYAAGEMGCEYPYIYNVGGNISEAIGSGRHAARIMAALESWE